MKKILLMGAFILLCIGMSACSNGTAKSELRIASEGLDGDFIGGFSNSDYDSDIMEMIHGYSTYEYDETGKMILNEVPVVEVQRTMDEENGNVHYNYTIANDLQWSDGHPLTASDYVFAVLFDSSKEWIDVGALNANYDHVLGYMEYSSSSADTTKFPGIILEDDTHFSILLDGSMLPYYNESILALVTPRPMHDFTNDLGSIVSDESGSRLQGISMSEVSNYAKDEYRLAPRVTCGPYMFESYDNKMVKLKKNPNFKGDFRKQIPEIETIVIKEMDSSLHVEALINGEVDLISNIIEYEDVQKARLQNDLEIIEFESSAYGNLAFACDFGPTSEEHVRKAISYALDKNELIQTALDGMATPIASDYVSAQWMAKELELQLQNLNPYTFHLGEAMKELNQSSYIYEQDGTTLFDEMKLKEDGSYLRYNELKEPLEIRHLGSEGNVITDSIQLQMNEAAPKIGMKFSVDYGDFGSITQNYYDGVLLGEKRLYHSFNLASVLQPGYDPYYNFHGRFAGTSMNPAGIDDKKLNEILDIMVKSDIQDKDGYLKAWLDYEVRFNEVLPAIPLYISQEHVIYKNHLQHVEVNTMESYSHIISGIRLK